MKVEGKFELQWLRGTEPVKLDSFLHVPKIARNLALVAGLGTVDTLLSSLIAAVLSGCRGISVGWRTYCMYAVNFKKLEEQQALAVTEKYVRAFVVQNAIFACFDRRGVNWRAEKDIVQYMDMCPRSVLDNCSRRIEVTMTNTAMLLMTHVEVRPREMIHTNVAVTNRCAEDR